MITHQNHTESTSWNNGRCIFTPCILCGSTELVSVATPGDIASQQRYLERFHHQRLAEHVSPEIRQSSLADRVSFTQDYETYIVACRVCGLLFRNPHPSAEAITKAYIEDQYDQQHLQAEFEAQLAWARGKLPILARHLPVNHSVRIIEVGSFVGGFLAAAREEGWNILGVDPGDAVVRFCRDKQLPVFHGTLEEADLPSGAVDAVVVWNTFDQLPNPRTILRTIIRALKPNGLLTVRIPHGVCYQAAMARTEKKPWMRKLIYPGLAWNNLLGFPYSYGYGLTMLDRLMSEFGLIRQAVYPDTLMNAPVPGRKWWVTFEERLIKQLCRLMTIITLRRGEPSLSRATWLDVYFRKPELLIDPHPRDLGVVPVGSHAGLGHTIL